MIPGGAATAAASSGGATCGSVLGAGPDSKLKGRDFTLSCCAESAMLVLLLVVAIM